MNGTRYAETLLTTIFVKTVSCSALLLSIQLLNRFVLNRFGKQQKYHKGKYTKQEWLFGMIDQEMHACFVTPVERGINQLCSRSSKEELNTWSKSLIEHLENLEIVSDRWKSFKNLI